MKLGFLGAKTERICVKQNKKMSMWNPLGVINCADHEPVREPYKLTAKRAFGIIETEDS